MWRGLRSCAMCCSVAVLLLDSLKEDSAFIFEGLEVQEEYPILTVELAS
jgi:hypothetical protein